MKPNPGRAAVVARIAPRWVAVASVLLLAAAPGSAQVPGPPVEPAEVPPPNRGVFLQPPIALPDAGGPLVPSVGPPTCLPGGCQPPGSVPGPQACDPFRRETRWGSIYTGLPRTLIWEPPLADKWAPRFQVMPTTLSNNFTQRTLDNSIGGTLGLLRIEPANWAAAIQIDVFALVNTRISSYDVLVDSDYRYGFPVTFARGAWFGKIGYEHFSSHLGDETIVRTGRAPIDYIRDEIALGVGRWLFDYRARVYGQMAWAFNQVIPGNPSPFRFDVGAEWICNRATGCWGKPFAAVNLNFNGANDYDPNLTLQLGWQWRDPTRRLGQCRLFGEYYTGHSPFGQLFQERESWFGFGAAFDY
jgi:hypothetical protein